MAATTNLLEQGERIASGFVTFIEEVRSNLEASEMLVQQLQEERIGLKERIRELEIRNDALEARQAWPQVTPSSCNREPWSCSSQFAPNADLQKSCSIPVLDVSDDEPEDRPDTVAQFCLPALMDSPHMNAGTMNQRKMQQHLLINQFVARPQMPDQIHPSNMDVRMPVMFSQPPPVQQFITPVRMGPNPQLADVLIQGPSNREPPVRIQHQNSNQAASAFIVAPAVSNINVSQAPRSPQAIPQEKMEEQQAAEVWEAPLVKEPVEDSGIPLKTPARSPRVPVSAVKLFYDKPGPVFGGNRKDFERYIQEAKKSKQICYFKLSSDGKDKQCFVSVEGQIMVGNVTSDGRPKCDWWNCQKLAVAPSMFCRKCGEDVLAGKLVSRKE